MSGSFCIPDFAVANTTHGSESVAPSYESFSCTDSPITTLILFPPPKSPCFRELLESLHGLNVEDTLKNVSEFNAESKEEMHHGRDLLGTVNLEAPYAKCLRQTNNIHWTKVHAGGPPVFRHFLKPDYVVVPVDPHHVDKAGRSMARKFIRFWRLASCGANSCRRNCCPWHWDQYVLARTEW